jgi:uncharacterized membrane-anchored protein
MKKGFLIIVLAQALLLVSIIGYRQYWVNNGTRILLKTAPVDPRDIFRGDYVRLGYGISTLDLDQLGAAGDFRRNEKIFVNLKPGVDGTYHPLAISRTMPAGKFFIQGRTVSPTMTVSRWRIVVRDDEGRPHTLRPPWFAFKKDDRLFFCLNRNGDVMQQAKAESANRCWNKDWQGLEGTVTEVIEEKARQVSVEYGIESYFVEEGKGKAIEAARNARDLKVEVSLRNDGKGIITGLYLDGKIVR